MGSLFRPRYRDKSGQKHTSSVWWIQFYAGGKCIRESAETSDHAEAKKHLKRREGEAAKGGRVVKSLERKVRFSELAELVTTDYKLNNYKSLVDLEIRHRLHIIPFFGSMKANRITENDVDKYILQRRDEGASNGTINRELSVIRKAYSLGIQKRIVSDRPHITMLAEDNVRTGFFEPDQFQSVLSKLPERLKPVARLAYVTGWRKQELLTLQWRQVDFDARCIRLEPGTTKNKEARIFPFTSELESVLVGQRAKADGFKTKGIITPFVFFHLKAPRIGKPIGEFKKSWKTACKDAGQPGMIFHDFRRTAVRNLVRAGIPEAVAMKLTGHKTRSVFERYNIVSESDLFNATQRLENYLSKEPDKVSKIRAIDGKL